MLIQGQDLTPKQTEQVLCAFVYRWTTGNEARTRVYFKRVHPKIPLISDHEWLNKHAFHFLKDGSRLMHNRQYCDPDYLA